MATAAAPRVEKRREPDIRIRPFVLLAVLAGICAWYFFGQPGNDIARLIAIAEPYFDPAPEDRIVVILPAEPAEPVPAAPDEDGAADAVAESPVRTDPGSAPAESTEPATLPAAEPTPLAAGEPRADSAAAAPETEVAAQDEAPVVPDPQPASPDTEAVSPDTEAPSPATGPGNTLVRSLVTVYERDGAARISFRRPVGGVGHVFWWTGDHTAIADSDYIALEEPVVAFDSDEEAETLHVPLIDDSLPEPKETFYVFLGQRNLGSGRLEPIAMVRVDINDDD